MSKLTLLGTLASTLFVIGCANETPDPKPTVVNLIETTVAIKPTVNSLPCLKAVEGTLLDAIAAFDSACGITSYRNCEQINTGVHQCTNQRESVTAIIPQQQKPAVEKVTVVPYVPPVVVKETSVAIETVEEPPVIVVAQSPAPSQEEPELAFEYEENFIPEPLQCKTDEFTKAELDEIFKEACLPNGFEHVVCNTNTGSWSCSSTPTFVPDPIQGKIVQPRVKKLSTIIDPTTLNGFVAYAKTVSENNAVYSGDVWANEVYNNDRDVFIAGLTDNVVAAIEYILISYPDVDVSRITVVGVNTNPLRNNEVFDDAKFIGVYTKDGIISAIELQAR